jgi:arsenical pump membrane protein
MALPWLVALAVEWAVMSRWFAGELRAPAPANTEARVRGELELPVFALSVLALTLVGFAFSSALGIAPVWVAVAGALALIAHTRPRPRELAGAVEPPFLIFVLALGIVVSGASRHGLAGVVDELIPAGAGVLALLAVAGVSALLANLVNNLPATLIILPVAASSGTGAVLAMLLGVNIGPNLTYVGSLATLLWRRIVHAHEQETDLGEFTRLGALTVPPALLAATLGLWLALQAI